MTIDIHALQTVGDDLVRARRAARLTQVDLANLAGLSIGSLKRYERSGYRTAPLEKVQLVAQALARHTRSSAEAGWDYSEPDGSNQVPALWLPAVRPVRLSDLSTAPFLISALGPFQLQVDGVPLPIGNRVALMIALLSIHGPAVYDTIGEWLYGAERPASWQSALRTSISAARSIRDQFGRSLIADSRPVGLSEDLVDTDLELFRRLGSDALDRGAVLAAKTALGLWRGEPLQEPFFDAAGGTVFEQSSLHALRVSMEDLILSQSDCPSQVLKLAASADPFNEKRWLSLGRVLAKSGDRRGALRVLHELRRRLAMVGLNIGSEVATLEAEILAPVNNAECIDQDWRLNSPLELE